MQLSWLLDITGIPKNWRVRAPLQLVLTAQLYMSADLAAWEAVYLQSIAHEVQVVQSAAQLWVASHQAATVEPF